MRYIFLRTLFFLLIFAITFVAVAQPRPPDPDGEPVPIAGIEWLLLAGGFFGVRKIFQNRRSQKHG